MFVCVHLGFFGGFSGSVTLLFSVMLLAVNNLSRLGSNKG